MKYFKLGVTFKSENLKSLKKNLTVLTKNFDYCSFKKDRERYINFTNDYIKFIDAIHDEIL